MKPNVQYIAWLFILVFAIFGIEKTNFSVEPICSKSLKFCPTANMYVYNIYELSSNHSKKDSPETGSSKVVTISCETFFIHQNELVMNTKAQSFNSSSVFYYKHVIHSTPYIPLVDPPPIV